MTAWFRDATGVSDGKGADHRIIRSDAMWPQGAQISGSTFQDAFCRRPSAQLKPEIIARRGALQRIHIIPSI
jgi:hypothetical protein